jgi:glycosyltransferase involved in cell wall biosynthesis
MRISFLNPNSIQIGGGAEEWILSTAQLLSLKHDVTIYGFRSKGKYRFSREYVVSRLGKAKYLELPSILLGRGNPIPSPSGIRTLTRALISSNVNYVVVPSPPQDLIIYPLLRACASPSIAGFHGQLRHNVLLQRLYAPFFEQSLNSFKALHSLNLATYRSLESHRFANAYYFPNGIDTKVYQICRDPIESGSFVVLFSGRLVEEKGVDRLIAIIMAANVRGSMNRLKFQVIGTGDLEELVRESGRLHTNVNFLGYVSREELIEEYRRANLFLIPSKSEGMPLRLIEAQSCGLPAIGSRIAGVEDVIVDGINGILVDEDNTEKFVDAIEHYYALWELNLGDYHELNKRIRESAVAKYDITLMMKRFENMLNEVSRN